MTNELMWSNPKLTYFLGLPTDTALARETAAMLCERIDFEVCGIESLKTFLTTPFMIPGFIPRDHICSLTIVWRPPYWDLLEFSGEVAENYDQMLSTSTN